LNFLPLLKQNVKRKRSNSTWKGVGSAKTKNYKNQKKTGIRKPAMQNNTEIATEQAIEKSKFIPYKKAFPAAMSTCSA